MAISTGNLDSELDDPKDARAQLLAAVQEVNRLTPLVDGLAVSTVAGERALSYLQEGSAATYYGVSTPADGFAVDAGLAHMSGVVLGAGILDSVKLRVLAVNSGLFDLLICRNTASNTFQVLDRWTVSVSATGTVNLLGGRDFDLRTVGAGQYLGLYAASGGPIFSCASGGVRWLLAADPGSPGDAAHVFSSSGQTIQIGATVVVGQSPAEALAVASTASATATAASATATSAAAAAAAAASTATTAQSTATTAATSASAAVTTANAASTTATAASTTATAAAATAGSALTAATDAQTKAVLGQRALAYASFAATSAYAGVVTQVDGFGAGPTTTQVGSATLAAGLLDSLKLRILSVGSGTLDILLLNTTGANAFQVVDRFTVTIPATGEVNLYGGKDFALRSVQAGQYLGFYAASGGPTLTYVSGGVRWSLAGDPGSSSNVYSISGHTLQIGAGVTTGQSPALALAAAASAAATAVSGQRALAHSQFAASATYVGVVSMADGFSAADTITHVSAVQVTPGQLDSVKLRVASVGNGSIDVLILNSTGSSAFQVADRFTVTVSATGDVTLQAGKDFALRTVLVDQYLGFYAASGGPVLQCVSGGVRWTLAGDPGSSAHSYGISGQTLQVGCTVVQGQSPAIALAAANLAATAASSGQAAYSIDRAQAALSLYGITSPVAGDAPAGDGRTTFGFNPATLGGLVERIKLYVRVLGSGLLSVVFAPAASPIAVSRRLNLTLSRTGVVELIAGRDFDSFTIETGWIMGVYSPSGGAQTSIAYGGGSGYTYDGDPGNPGDAGHTYSGAAIGVQVRYQVVPPRISQSFPWQDKSAVLLGDSITYMGLYVTRLRESTGLVVANNLGLVGQVLRTMADDAWVTPTNMANVALATVGSGVNDWHHGDTTIGSPSDAASANTIYGAVRNIVEKLHAANPLTLPAFFGPFNSGAYMGGPTYGATNAYGLNIVNITSTMEDACGRLGVPFFPTHRRMGVNDLNLTTWMPDNLHPAQALANRFGAEWGSFINRIAPR